MRLLNIKKIYGIAVYVLYYTHTKKQDLMAYLLQYYNSEV